MIRTDGIPTIAFANLKHVSEAEIEEEIEEYLDYLLDNEIAIPASIGEPVPAGNPVQEVWDNPGPEWDWLFQHRLQEELEA